MKTILTPIDFSSATSSVIAAAANLARVFDGRVVLLNVVRPPLMVGEGAYTVGMTNVVDEMARSSLRALEEWQGRLENEFVQADVIQLTGMPVTLILEQARKLKADYIVLGSHGHTAFYDLVVGSTTAAVVKRSTCPVVVVPVAPRPKKKSAARKRMRFERTAAGLRL